MPFLRRSTFACLALLLALSRPLLADQRRGFVNNSNYWWTVATLPRKTAEMGDMTFTLDGVQVGKLGASSKTPIRLAPMSSYMVLYNSKLGEFHHAFTLTRDAEADRDPIHPVDPGPAPSNADGAQPAQLRFAYDHSAYDGLAKVLVGTRVPLVPIEVPTALHNLVLDSSSAKGDVGINLGIPGELIIHPTPIAKQPKPLMRHCVIDALDGGPGWQFELATSPTKPNKGTLLVMGLGPDPTAMKAGVPVTVDTDGYFRVWVKAAADGTFALTFILWHPDHGRCQINIASNPAGGFLEDMTLAREIDQPKDKALGSWVISDHFTVERYIQISNPAGVSPENCWGGPVVIQ